MQKKNKIRKKRKKRKNQRGDPWKNRKKPKGGTLGKSKIFRSFFILIGTFERFYRV